MTKADTATYEQLIVEVEFVPASGVFTKVCGMRGATVTRTANLDTDETPDCDDESLPWDVNKDVRSLEVSVSGTGVWALTSHKSMMNWFYRRGVATSGLNVQIRNSKVEASGDSGDPIIESGVGILSTLSNDKQKGKKVTADIEIEFTATPTITEKS